MSYTRGPWHLSPSSTYVRYMQSDLTKPNICSLSVFGGPPDEKFANARLIASAPVLLEQLKIANTNIALAHSDRQEHNLCFFGVDNCSCPLAEHWRHNNGVIRHAEGL